MSGVSAEDEYERSDGERSALIRLAADDFQRWAATEQEQRAAICRYFRRGFDADCDNGEFD
jgi:hypothetical protein